MSGVAFTHSWASMLRTARASVWVLVVTALAWMLPPQIAVYWDWL
jgi:hypothetical protein